MAVKFWVPAATASVRGVGISPAPLNKQTTGVVDETDRVSIAQPDSLWRLRAFPGAVAASHGGITKVTLHARIYTSNNGTYSWDFGTNDAFVAPYFKQGSDYTYSTPDWVNAPTQFFVGWQFQNPHNFNLGGQPSAKVISWELPGSWDNAALAALEFGLAMDEAGISANRLAGYLPLDGPAGNTPRYNVSQLILEVDALDPAPSYGAGIVAVFS